jgi:hypothetical protein
MELELKRKIFSERKKIKKFNFLKRCSEEQFFYDRSCKKKRAINITKLKRKLKLL